MDIPQAAFLCLLHYGTDGFLVTLEILFHSAEYLRLVLHSIQLIADFLHLLSQFVPALCPGFLPQGIAGNGILIGGYLFLRLLERLLAVSQIITRLLLTGFAGLQILLNLGNTGLTLTHIDLQGLDVCFTGCQVTGKGNLTGAQLHKLAGNTLRVGGHRHQFFLQFVQFPGLLGQDGIDFSDTDICLLHLHRDTAAAGLLPLQILFVPGDGFVVMGNGALDQGNLSVNLLAGALQ